MLEFAYYSVISPEGCAGILWRDGSQAPQAAEALKLTSKDLLNLKLIDDIIAEPLGGAHRNIHDTVYNVEQYITRTLAALKRMSIETLLNDRYAKLRSIGGAPAAIAPEKQAEKKISILEARPAKPKPVSAKV
jgi:acetyl-CoA carboxylase carboxyl transferase subunit alpha